VRHEDHRELLLAVQLLLGAGAGSLAAAPAPRLLAGAAGSLVYAGLLRWFESGDRN